MKDPGEEPLPASLRALAIAALICAAIAGCQCGGGDAPPAPDSGDTAGTTAPAATTTTEPPFTASDTVASIRAAAAMRSVEFELAAKGNDTLRTSGCEPATQTITGGVTVIIDRSCFRCDLLAATDTLDGASRKVLRGFATAFSRYPETYVRATQLRAVALCRHIEPAIPTGADAGTPDPHLIGGTVDRARHMLLLSVEPMDLSGEDIVHHELFHLFDFVTSLQSAGADPEWSAASNKRVAGGAASTSPAGSGPGTGFLNEHARANYLEDKAVVFQFMMARPAVLCDRMEADSIVAAKVALLRKRLRKHIPETDARTLESGTPCLAERASPPPARSR
jgi:hypothetical protein